MLPLRIFNDGRYEVAPAVLGTAAPHLSAHYDREQHRQLVTDLRRLHQPTVPDHDGLTDCAESAHVWPCSTERILAGPECVDPLGPVLH